MKPRVLLLVVLMSVSPLAVGREASRNLMGQKLARNGDKMSNPEKVLWDADPKWLCGTRTGPFHKAFKDCVEFRRKYWADQFFEVSYTGHVRTKAQMIEERSKMNFSLAEPHPTDFKLMAVYGNFALATDHTVVTIRDTGGKVVSIIDTRVLRMFVKENGNWKPAGAALVPIVSK